MDSSQPIVRQIKLIFVIPQIMLYLIFIVIFTFAGLRYPALFAVIAYLLTAYSTRILIPRFHRKGVSLYKRSSYEKAIVEFKKSYEFFTRYHWIDKYRFIILFSGSRIAYKEMALLNIAYCYGQLGNGSKAKEYYKRTLAEFPDSKIAESALRMLDSVQNNF